MLEEEIRKSFVFLLMKENQEKFYLMSLFNISDILSSYFPRRKTFRVHQE